MPTLLNIQMKRIGEYIIAVDNFLDKDFCQNYFSYLYNKTNNKCIDSSTMPWHIGNNIYYNDVDDLYLKNHLKNINYMVADLISNVQNVQHYPHFCDLVLWKEGQYMVRHVDNGFGQPYEIERALCVRTYSAIIYLNNDYKGGETVVKINENKDYISNPKVGSLLAFSSDQKSEHGVNKITSGTRATIAMWFTDNKNFCDI